MDWTELVVETTNEAIDAVTNILMENEAGGVQIDDNDLNDVRISRISQPTSTWRKRFRNWKCRSRD